MLRRDFIKYGVAGAALVSMGEYNIFAPALSYADERAPAARSRLPIPPILEKSMADGGEERFVFAADYGERSFLPGITTETLGYNGSFLGPTIRVRNDQQVNLRVRNRLK